MKHTSILVALACGALVSACGGGGGFEAPMVPPANEVPPNATASVANFVAYLDKLPASESAEPLDITSAMPPSTDTDEPLAPT